MEWFIETGGGGRHSWNGAKRSVVHTSVIVLSMSIRFPLGWQSFRVAVQNDIDRVDFLDTTPLNAVQATEMEGYPRHQVPKAKGSLMQHLQAARVC